MTPFRVTPQLPLYDVWVRQVTGVFGWLDVALPAWMYPVSTALAAGVTVTAVALLTRVRGRRHLPVCAFFALTAIALLGVLHITEYRVLIAGQAAPLPRLLGLLVGVIVLRAPRAVRPAIGGSTLAAPGLRCCLCDDCPRLLPVRTMLRRPLRAWMPFAGIAGVVLVALVVSATGSVTRRDFVLRAPDIQTVMLLRHTPRCAKDR